MIHPTGKKIFISWAPYSRRSQSLSAEMDIESYFIHYLKFQRPAYTPFKYILQAGYTLALLLKEQPRTVFVQEPPVFATLFVYLYTLLSFGQAHFIVDAHSGALLHPWWKPFRGLQKFLYRRALTVITTNSALAEIINTWGAKAMAVAGPPINLPPGEAMPLGETFNLVLVNTFSNDEPVAVAVEAVAPLADVRLYITGDLKKAPASLLQNAPANVTFTGFLPDEDYLRLLRGADAIMTLTDDDFTLQLGAVEAVALGKPILTSDWPFLREYFGRGTVYVANTPESVRQGIIHLRRDLANFSQEIPALRQAHQEEWGRKSEQLRQLMLAGEAS